MEGRACLLAMPACVRVVCIHMHVISGNFTAAAADATGQLAPFSLYPLLFSSILRSFVSPRGGAPLPPSSLIVSETPG